jgi:hypothetical protein
VAGPHVVVELLGPFLANGKALDTSEEVSALIVLAWRYSIYLTLNCKALWSVWLFAKEDDLTLWLCNNLGTLWRIMTGSDTFTCLLRTLFTNRERICIVAKLGVSQGCPCSADLTSDREAFRSAG